MDTVLWIFMCMFILIGIVCIIGDYAYVRSTKKPARGNYRVITLYDNPAEVEQLLNRYLLRLGWSGPDGVILLVDMGMGPESAKICKIAMNDMYGAYICTENEMPETLRKLDKMFGGGVIV